MLDSVIKVTNIDVDVTATLRRRRNTDAPIDDPDIASVNKKVAGSRTPTSRRQDQHQIDTDKLNGVNNDYK
jgi:hypothetical protein